MATRTRAGVGRRSLFGRLCQSGVRDAVEADGDDQGVLIPPVMPTASGNLVAPTGFDAKKMEELITESIAKGVELGIVKALSGVDVRPGKVSTPMTTSATVAQPPAAHGSASVIIPITVAQVTPPIPHPPHPLWVTLHQQLQYLRQLRYTVLLPLHFLCKSSVGQV